MGCSGARLFDEDQLFLGFADLGRGGGDAPTKPLPSKIEGGSSP
jgi:hypothetical protein